MDSQGVAMNRNLLLFGFIFLAFTCNCAALAGNITQVAEFPGLTPQQLYDAYLSSKGHAAMTGFPATFYRPSSKNDVAVGQEGDELHAFGMNGADGKLHYIIQARLLRLVPGQEIVSTWKATTWNLPADAAIPDCILVLTFKKTQVGAEIRLVQVNVPDFTDAADMKAAGARSDMETEADHVNTNWYFRYWEPMHKFFAAQAKSTP
jgi:uncharacterized protein YndB with AHSA1/START domain